METVEYIQDNRFSRGFQVHGPTHEEGIIARYPGGDPQPPLLDAGPVVRPPPSLEC